MKSRKAKAPGGLEWLIEVNAEANREVAKKLFADEDALCDVPCEDGKRRDFWRISYPRITKLAQNAKTCHFTIIVWSRVGKGLARRVPNHLLPQPLRKKQIAKKPKWKAKEPEPPKKDDRSPFF